MTMTLNRARLRFIVQNTIANVRRTPSNANRTLTISGVSIGRWFLSRPRANEDEMPPWEIAMRNIITTTNASESPRSRKNAFMVDEFSLASIPSTSNVLTVIRRYRQCRMALSCAPQIDRERTPRSRTPDDAGRPFVAKPAVRFRFANLALSATSNHLIGAQQFREADIGEGPCKIG